MACAKCHLACFKMLRQFAPVCAITRPFDSKFHPVGAICADGRLPCATWWLVCAKGRQISINSSRPHLSCQVGPTWQGPCCRGPGTPASTLLPLPPEHHWVSRSSASLQNRPYSSSSCLWVLPLYPRERKVQLYIDNKYPYLKWI